MSWYDDAPRWWYWPPWRLTNPVWPLWWRGGDEWGRQTLVIQPPLLGAFIFPVTDPCAGCAIGYCEAHDDPEHLADHGGEWVQRALDSLHKHGVWGDA